MSQGRPGSAGAIGRPTVGTYKLPDKGAVMAGATASSVPGAAECMGAENPFTSWRLHILVQEAAESVSS